MTAQTPASASAAKNPQVSVLHYHRQSKKLDVVFADGQQVQFNAEFLRVYAVKLVFDDGHQTGLYSWAYLAQLAAEQEALWVDYLKRLKQANSNRETELMIKQL